MVNILKVNDKIEILKAVLSIIIAEGTGVLGVYLGKVDSKIYDALKKPVIVPPSYIFSIVWIILYFLIGLAAYRIWEWKKQKKYINGTLKLYGFQLLLNFLWPTIFFRLRLYGLAFVELLVLIIFIVLTTFKFFRQDKLSGLLMIPYIICSSFAAVLNFSLWFLNC